ncbi:MAG TPA: energy transducer TonB [Gemmatimonadaceae bacterium]|nr:energy transducer TonB [Gemmatimonadaceae bacterium]
MFLLRLALVLVSAGYTYVGGMNGGSVALWYGGDQIWVYGSSPQGPFVFHGPTAALGVWADSASVTSMPNRTTARFSYFDASVRDTVLVELTRLSGDPDPAFQCTATVGRWSGSVVLSPDSARRFFALLHGPPTVASPQAHDPQEAPYFDFQVQKQATPTSHNASPMYPEPLRVANVSGEVLGQFVIDTMGLAEVSTFKILKSTNPWLTSAVLQALPYFRFKPAELKGQKVRELIQEPFAFNVRR